MYKIGKGNGLFKKSEKEKTELIEKRRKKMKYKLNNKLKRAKSKHNRYESMIQEMEFEEIKKKKLKELEEQLEVNGAMPLE